MSSLKDKEATLRLVCRSDLFSEKWASVCMAQYLALLEQVDSARPVDRRILLRVSRSAMVCCRIRPAPAWPAQVPVTVRMLEQPRQRRMRLR